MKTILVVNPRAPERRQVREDLSRRGYRVLEAANLDEAGPLVAESPVDVVVLDHRDEPLPTSWLPSLMASGERPAIVVVGSEAGPETPETAAPAASGEEIARSVERALSGAAPAAATSPAASASPPAVATPPPASPPATPTPSASPPPTASTPTRREPVTRSSLPRVLAALRDAYARNLPEKLASLAAAAHGAVREHPVPGALAQGTLFAHRLCGTAASYGFPALGEAAGRLEEALEALATVPDRERAAHREEIEDLLEDAMGGGEPTDVAGAVTALTAVADTHTDEPTSLPVANDGAAVSHAPLVQLGSARVLVVDADPGVRTRVMELADRQMLEVLTAATLPAALGLAREMTLDAAMIGIPPDDPEEAFELAQALRALPNCARLPIAFMSAERELEYHVAATHVGAALFLVKPFDDDKFSTTVRQLLAARQSERPRVLIVDDDHSFAARLAAVLAGAGMEMHVIEDPARVLDALDETHPDAVLLDLMLPGLSGIEVCRMLRILPRWQELPVLFITSRANLESRMAAFAAGADDYLVKPLVDEELRSRIEVRVERARFRREREERDALTGLLLRRAFLQDLGNRLGEAQRHGLSLSVSLLDLDHFKSINDSRGHLAGDRVLKGLGGLLERRFRSEDLRGRWGGEEFILAFPGERAHVVQSVVERLLGEFQRLAFVSDRGSSLRASFSAGVATYPDDGTTVEELLQAADRRLYHAKETGRARVVARD